METFRLKYLSPNDKCQRKEREICAIKTLEEIDLKIGYWDMLDYKPDILRKLLYFVNGRFFFFR